MVSNITIPESLAIPINFLELPEENAYIFRIKSKDNRLFKILLKEITNYIPKNKRTQSIYRIQ